MGSEAGTHFLDQHGVVLTPNCGGDDQWVNTQQPPVTPNRYQITSRWGINNNEDQCWVLCWWPQWKYFNIYEKYFVGTDSHDEAVEEQYETHYACEDSQLNITCSVGLHLNIIRANYGRFSIAICNTHGNTDWSVNCMSPRTLRVIRARWEINWIFNWLNNYWLMN